MSSMQKRMGQQQNKVGAATCSAPETRRTGHGIESQGYSYIDLLLAQTTEPGNKSYEILSDLIEKAQDKL